jgi:Arc/MetJ family transcription regulator
LASRFIAGRGARRDNAHQEVYAMRTNIVLDDALVEEAMRLSGAKTKQEVVNQALQAWVARHRQRALRELVGQDLFDPDYDVREVRRRMGEQAG